MTFLWSGLLLLLAVLPILVIGRWWVLRRPRTGVRFSSLSLIRDASPRGSRVRRHLPFALFVVGLGSLVLGMARPAAIVPVPTGSATVVLAMDVSRSMCATDIPPNRLVAAEEAASAFVESQDSKTQIGVVAFAGFAEIIQVPTNDEEVLLDVIAALATGRRTAVGSAILESIDAIAEIDPSIPASIGDGDAEGSGSAPAPVPEGAYAPAIIVLLTDGASNAGPDPVVAAQQAADRGIRVYTIGFGTADPGGRPPSCGAQFVGREPGENGLPERDFGGGFGGGGGGTGQGGGMRRAIDEVTLIAVAEATGGEYYPAESAQQLNDVFAKLPTNLIIAHEVVEISVIFTAVAVLLVALAILLGQAWRPLSGSIAASRSPLVGHGELSGHSRCRGVDGIAGLVGRDLARAGLPERDGQPAHGADRRGLRGQGDRQARGCRRRKYDRAERLGLRARVRERDGLWGLRHVERSRDGEGWPVGGVARLRCDERARPGAQQRDAGPGHGADRRRDRGQDHGKSGARGRADRQRRGEQCLVGWLGEGDGLAGLRDDERSRDGACRLVGDVARL